MTRITSDLLTLASKKMKYLNARQKLVAQNVMNARMPKYLPKDIVPFQKTLKSSPMSVVNVARTSSKHFSGDRFSQAVSSSFEAKETYSKKDITPSGNAVVLEKELMKASDIGSDYKLTTTLASEYLKLRKLGLNIKK